VVSGYSSSTILLPFMLPMNAFALKPCCLRCGMGSVTARACGAEPGCCVLAALDMARDRVREVAERDVAAVLLRVTFGPDGTCVRLLVWCEEDVGDGPSRTEPEKDPCVGDDLLYASCLRSVVWRDGPAACEMGKGGAPPVGEAVVKIGGTIAGRSFLSESLLTV